MTCPEIAVQIERLPHAPQSLPEYKTAGSAGMDLQAAINNAITLAPGERTMIPTGLKIALPDGFEAQIRSRSGLAIKFGVAVTNGVGTIDWDYRDEVKVGLINLSQESYTIEPGDRIAQMIIAPVTRGIWVEVDTLDAALASGRGGGFGSTGR